jgi:carboxymethylenebutenolidase
MATGQVAPSDPRVVAARAAVAAKWGKLDCYVTRPASGHADSAAIIVAHDKLGLTPHFEDVARRLAVEGFAVLAPDFASRFGGTPTEPGPAIEVVGMETWADFAEDILAAVDFLKDAGAGKIGALGFGFGGTGVNLAVISSAEIVAAASYYSHPPPADQVVKVHTALLLNFAGKDQFIDPEIQPFAAAAKHAGLEYEVFIYPDTVRGFDDDTAPSHYKPDSAALAWSRTISFFKTHLTV